MLRKPNGFCNAGHDQRSFGYIDIEKTWRCRLCKREQNLEREYWKLVEIITQFEPSSQRYKNAYEKLIKFHWKIP